METISGTAWPERYTFSPAVRSGNLLFISGTTATDAHQQIVGRGDIVAQTRQIFRTFETILTAAGGSLRNIVETTEFITTTENYRKTAEVRREVFGGPALPGGDRRHRGQAAPRGRADRDLRDRRPAQRASRRRPFATVTDPVAPDLRAAREPDVVESVNGGDLGSPQGCGESQEAQGVLRGGEYRAR